MRGAAGGVRLRGTRADPVTDNAQARSPDVARLAGAHVGGLVPAHRHGNALTLGSYIRTDCHKGANSIGDLVVVGRDLDDAELATVEADLAQKWRIALL